MSKYMFQYGFEVFEEIALFTLECAANFLHPCWEGSEWAQDRQDDLLMRAHAIMMLQDDYQ